MVAEVIRLINGPGVRRSNESSSKSTALITRDLLGGCCSDSKELDLDSQVPSGWEKRLDLKSGKVYLERSNYSTSTLVHKQQQTSCNNQTVPAPATKLPLNLFEDTKLELKLLPISSSRNYHSVCTLEKVKSALERAEKELSTRNKRKSSISSSSSSSSIMSMSMSSSSSSNYSNSSIEDMSSSNSFAAGCPSCLIYVLISKTNPRCPRCNSTIVVPILPHHVGMKKPRIDLNISI